MEFASSVLRDDGRFTANGYGFMLALSFSVTVLFLFKFKDRDDSFAFSVDSSLLRFVPLGISNRMLLSRSASVQILVPSIISCLSLR